MGRREEREPGEEVLNIDFDTLGETGCRIARDNQADQNAVHIDLMAIRRGTATEATAVRESGIGGGVKGDYVTAGAVGNRDGPAEIDRFDDVDARSLQSGDGAGRNA